jgi:hypothetical protein
MTKPMTWRCFSVAMILVLTLGVCAMAVAASPALANGAVATWDLQTVDDCDVWDCEIALDSNGYPHISYTTGPFNSLHYARWTGTAWETEMVDDAPAMATSIALDSNGYPHIGYGTFAVGDTSLHYARWTGTAWETETVDERDVWDCEIALDSNDYPHIGYTLGDSGSVQYARWTGTAWETDMVDEGPALPVSIALDSNGYPHISYSTWGPHSLHYARWTGTAWAKQTVVAVDVDSTSIALDSNDYPHISYATGGLFSLHYARWTGTTWDIQTVDESEHLHSTSIALDSNGYPHISYATGGLQSLHYAHWTGTAWETEMVDDVQAFATSIALDIGDYPHISYATDGFGSLHYARLIPPDTDTVETATGTGTATFSTSGGGIAKLTAVAPAAIACPPLGIAFPQGLFSFNILGLSPGETVTVTITFPSVVPEDTRYLKCPNGEWIDCTSIMGDNDGDNVLTLTLTDGGLGDLDGVANGTIVDPGGPATRVTVTAVSPNYGVQGQTLSTFIKGTSFTGATAVSFGAGITVNSFTVDSTMQIRASVTVAGNAFVGVRNISVTTPNGTGTLTDGFTVDSAAGPGASPTVQSPLNSSNVSLQYLSVNPPRASANQPITITTNVVNTGDEAGNINVTLKINGQVEESRMVSVGPHGTQPVKFTVTRAQPGTYNVDILGKSGSFTILGAGGTTGSNTGGVIALAIIGVLVIATLVVLLIRRT